MAGYLLDTHAAIWLLEGSSRLGKNVEAAVAGEETVSLSDISLLEIAMLVGRGKLTLRPNVADGLKAISEQLTILPINSAIALDAVSVALPQRDPFDRVITATARVHGLTLVTKDRQIQESGTVPTLW